MGFINTRVQISYSGDPVRHGKCQDLRQLEWVFSCKGTPVPYPRWHCPTRGTHHWGWHHLRWHHSSSRHGHWRLTLPPAPQATWPWTVRALPDQCPWTASPKAQIGYRTFFAFLPLISGILLYLCACCLLSPGSWFIPGTLLECTPLHSHA